jgi:hypothetical protein
VYRAEANGMKHFSSKSIPARLEPLLQAIVGGRVSGSAMRRAAEALTYIASRQKKVVLRRAQDLANHISTSTSAGDIWPCYFRTGENTTAVEVFAGLTRAEPVVASPPTLTVAVKTPDGTSTLSSGVLTHDGGSGSLPVTPERISHGRLLLDGLSPDTEYRIDSTPASRTAVSYMTIREAPDLEPDDDVLGVVSPNKYPVGGPIYDEHIQDLIAAANALWMHNAAHLLAWGGKYEAHPTAVGVPLLAASSADTYEDVDGVEFYLPTALRTTKKLADLQVRFGVLGERTAGSGTTDIRLVNSGLTDSLDLSFGAGSRTVWTVDSQSMPVPDDNWKLQFQQSNTSTTFALYGVTLFPHRT